MRLDAALDDILASSSHVKVLRALFALPSGLGRSGRDLARRAGVSHPRANQVLSSLAQQGLVSVERQPRADIYRLNRHHVLVDPLSELFEFEPRLKSELLAFIARELNSRRIPVMQARIFGSAARGTAESGSDIDLALVTTRGSFAAAHDAAQGIADAIRERFGVRLNVLVGSQSLKSRHTRHGAWQSIEQEGIDVLPASKAARDG